jgi:hypothetical protein
MGATMSQAGLQQAEQTFQSMLSGEQPDTQQQLDEQVPEEAEAEIEAEEPEIEAEAESEEIEAGEEEPEEAESQPQYHQIKLNGELYEITTEEALAGYQRQQDYTKKTQAIAEDKKQALAEQEAAKQDRLRYQQNLEHLVQQQQAQKPVEPDWDQLYEADPLEWMKQKENFRSQKEQNLELQQQHFQMQQQQQQEQQEQMKVHLSQQHQTLMDAIPEWQDQKVMQTEKAQIRDYAVNTLGYSTEEISQVYDARAVQALRHGMIASGLKGKGKVKLKPIAPAIRSVSPGSAPEQPRKQTSVHKAKIRLAKSGKMSDAAEIFKQLL